MEGKKLEDIYKKMKERDHILLRPDTYIGSIEEDQEDMWILPRDAKKFVFTKISYVKGLYKIFDEILVNAADNRSRSKLTNTIKVSIDQKLG